MNQLIILLVCVGGGYEINFLTRYIVSLREGGPIPEVLQDRVNPRRDRSKPRVPASFQKSV